MRFHWCLPIVVFSLLDGSLRAQCIGAESAGGPGHDKGMAVAVDGARNRYVAGYVTDPARFGSILLRGPSSSGFAFLAKYDSSGNVVWVKNITGPVSASIANDVALDHRGNIYVTGQFAYTATFDSISIASYGGNDIFLAKYDTSGNLLWAKHAGGAGIETGKSVAAYSYDDIPREMKGEHVLFDTVGNVYVCGSIQDTAHFDNITVIGRKRTVSMFLANYSPAGDVRWVKTAHTIDTLGSTSAYSVAVDHHGRALVTGYCFKPPMILGKDTLHSKSFTMMFLAQYDDKGIIRWLRGSDGDTLFSGAGGMAVATDFENNSVVTGFGSGRLLFDKDTVTLANNSVFLVKYDSTGKVQWVKGMPIERYGYSYDISCNKNNDIFFTGYFSGKMTFGNYSLYGDSLDVFVAKYNSAGKSLWAVKAGSLGTDGGLGIAADSTCNVDVTGWFRSTAHFGDSSLTSGGNTDLFLVTYGCATLSSMAERTGESGKFMLGQNYPNPFSYSTTVPCFKNEKGIFEVRDMLGRVVYRTTISAKVTSLAIDGRTLSNGMYWYSLSDGKNIQSRMMMVVK